MLYNKVKKKKIKIYSVFTMSHKAVYAITKHPTIFLNFRRQQQLKLQMVLYRIVRVGIGLIIK